MSRFITVFCLLLVTLFAIEMLSTVQERIILPFTGVLATISASLIQPFDSSVIAHGKLL